MRSWYSKTVLLTLATTVLISCSGDPAARRDKYIKSGDAYVAQKKFGEAVVEYRNAVKEDPRSGEARLKLADAYMAQSDAQHAYAEYIRGADLLPNDVDAQLKAAQMLLMAQRFDDAKGRAEKALALDPKTAWAWNRSGWLKSYLGDPETSIEHFERALRLSPFDPMNFNAFLGTGGAHFVAGRYAESVDWFEKGLLERPTATWVLRNLIPALALLGRQKEAQARKAQLLAEYPDLTVAKIVSALVFSRSTLDRIAEGLRLAGMPEE